MKPIKLGVVGCGGIAQIHHLPWLMSLQEEFEVVALCDLSAGLVEHVAGEFRVPLAVTDCNAALFDPANGYAGCIPGIMEVLRRQGLLGGRWCLNPDEVLSPGQAEEIDRVCLAYPDLNDDALVREHLETWLGD